LLLLALSALLAARLHSIFLSLLLPAIHPVFVVEVIFELLVKQ
jgi:hypothetical protein